MFNHLKSTTCYKGVVGGHFTTDIIAKKTLDARYWWPTLFKDIHDFCTNYDNYRKLKD
jgi:hypothetical protein